LSKDHEKLCTTSAVMIYATMSRLMVPSAGPPVTFSYRFLVDRRARTAEITARGQKAQTAWPTLSKARLPVA